ncbi:hypothetical protein TUBRATIS_15800 [Tubulinosema ratisbonensis]|uniref:Uncharacterized protein n=1 Tax=Tubulinosema ratisbonensis TaxID=291195 RepID=A0A437AL55_9MICR|nr:hypothetical protein TUBRATIS_15800 [Tubulinosema ratisbonensis]
MIRSLSLFILMRKKCECSCIGFKSKLQRESYLMGPFEQLKIEFDYSLLKRGKQNNYFARKPIIFFKKSRNCKFKFLKRSEHENSRLEEAAKKRKELKVCIKNHSEYLTPIKLKARKKKCNDKSNKLKNLSTKDYILMMKKNCTFEESEEKEQWEEISLNDSEKDEE